MVYSERGKISPQEALMSLRDTVMVAVGGIMAQIVELAPQVDYGEYELLATMLIGALMPFVNRILNIWRI